MITEWWYDSSVYDIDAVVVLARLTVRPDGTAAILTDGGHEHEFPTRDAAEMWLTDEEYYTSCGLQKRLTAAGAGPESWVQAPPESCNGDLLKHMVIRLG